MTATKDFFISYTGADQAWAEWIAHTLERAGQRTVLQAWDFRPGENFLRRMSEALAEAKRVVAVLSPAYLRSEYARDEWTAALVRERGEADRLLPVRVAACQLPPLLANRIYLDLAGLDEHTATQRLLAGIESGRVRPAGKLPFQGLAARRRSTRRSSQDGARRSSSSRRAIRTSLVRASSSRHFATTLPRSPPARWSRPRRSTAWVGLARPS